MHCIILSLSFSFFAYALHYWLELFYHHYSLVFSRESSAGTYEDDRKSTSGECFSIFVISTLSMRIGLLLPHMLELDFIFFPDSMFLLFFNYFFQPKKKKKIGEKDAVIFIVPL
jgi:hypothetical protein